MSSTYSGNPVSCAAALAVLDVIEEENILERSRKLGEQLVKRYESWRERFECVDHVRNLGGMTAFDLVTDKKSSTPDAQLTQAVVARARENGLILLSCGFYGNTIRNLVPVTVEEDVLEEGLGIIEQALEELTSSKVRATG